MKGINFEEWKALVKKNRQALNTKSNIYRSEPESLTWGGPGADKKIEYGQIHTITYNVTGAEVSPNWPTEIKSGRTLTLNNIPEIPYGAIGTITASAQYTLDDNVMVINNVQSDLTITISIGDVLYQNAKVGDYLYSDWTFGPTEKPGYLGRCIKGQDNQNTATESIWATSSAEQMKWSTELVDTDVPNKLDAKEDKNGQQNTQILLALGEDKYPAAAWAAHQFNGLGYLPAAGEVYDNVLAIRDLHINRSKTLWTSSENCKGNCSHTNSATTLSDSAITLSYAIWKTYENYSLAFCKLSGKPGKPINTNGHEYVDLGLPSGTLWATMNVGATSENDYGNYYMYGMGSKTYDSTDTPYDGTEDPLDLSKDTARVVWGGDWHMPTQALMQELIDNTTYQWVTNYNGSGINGGTFTATNGAILFIPAAGYWFNGSQNYVGNYGFYWGSFPNGSGNAYYLYFDDGSKNVNTLRRERGCSVRPVIG